MLIEQLGKVTPIDKVEAGALVVIPNRISSAYVGIAILREGQIFISYSHADEAMRNQLEKHLAMLKRDGRIAPWHDRRMLAGTEVDPTIDGYLNSADIILLLVSADFLASYYCYEKEMTRALARHEAREARVVPVILRQCDWKSSPLGKLLATPQDGRPISNFPDVDEAYLAVANDLRRIVDEMSLRHSAKSGISNAPVPGNQMTSVKHGARSQPSAKEESVREVHRSGNMRVRQSFSEQQRDEHLHQAYRYIQEYIQTSLEELENRNSDISCKFVQTSAVGFSATIYRDGKTASRAGVNLIITMGRGEIRFSNSGDASGSFNESLTVDADDQMLFLKPMMMGYHGHENAKLTFEGAAEYFWSRLIEPLQR